MAADSPKDPVRPVIALDGLSGSGKSTLARCLAAALGWHYVDSGAWYRAVTLACLERGVSCTDPRAVLALLSSLQLQACPDGSVLLGGTDPGSALRTPEIDASVALVADIPEVRTELNGRMRSLHLDTAVRGLVVDGRDASTVIFPGADLKVFVRVDLETRARRRWEQQRDAGLEITFEQVHSALLARDERDGARGESAPRIADGARVLDNNQITVEEATECLLSWAQPFVR